MFAVTLLPLAHSVLKELFEGEGSGVLIGEPENDIGHISEFIERVQDVGAVQSPQGRIFDAVEFVADIVAAIWLERWRLRQSRVIYVVRRAPWIVNPVGPDFQHVVRVVKVVEDDQAGLASIEREFSLPLKVPGIVARHIEFAQPVPGNSLPAPCPGRLIEGSPHIAVGAPLDGMRIAAVFIPKPWVDLDSDSAPMQEARNHFFKIFCLPGSAYAGHKA